MVSSDPLLPGLNINKKSSQNKKNVKHINNEHFSGSDDINSDSDYDDPFSMHLGVKNFD